MRAVIAPHNETVLSTQIPGKIATLTVRTGERYRQGDTLFTLDCRLYQAQWERTRRDLNHAERTLGMQRRLSELGSGSRYERNQAEAAAERAAADLAQLALTLEMCEVKASFDGRVVERKAQPEQVIAAGQPVLEVYDTSNYDIQLLVPSSWLGWLHRGLPFRLHIDETAHDYDAEVTESGARNDPASQSVKVFARFAAMPDAITAGMSGTAVFPDPATAASAKPGPGVAHTAWRINPGVAHTPWRIGRPPAP